MPPLEIEQKRGWWNMQRVLLLAGLIWLSAGICMFVTLSVVINSPSNAKLDIPIGVQYIGLGVAAIGVSHLVVYFAGRRKE